jgi:ABC-2 type transport system ATP-binding protein
MKALEVKNLKKSFGNVHAVQGVDFAAGKGEILSLLGPNGAGKSTTISMLSGLLTPGEGDAFIMGHSVSKEPEAAKRLLGVVPQDIALYPDLSARENGPGADVPKAAPNNAWRRCWRLSGWPTARRNRSGSSRAA